MHRSCLCGLLENRRQMGLCKCCLLLPEVLPGQLSSLCEPCCRIGVLRYLPAVGHLIPEFVNAVFLLIKIGGNSEVGDGMRPRISDKQ